MAKLREYWVEKNGNLLAVYQDGLEEYEKARRLAQREKGQLIEAEYEFSDSQLLEDYSKNS